MLDNPEYDINDPSNLTGISFFINNDNAKDGVNASKVEKDIITGTSKSKVDYDKVYESKLKELSKKYDVNIKSSKAHNSDDDIFGDILGDTKSKAKPKSKTSKSKTKPKSKSKSSDDDNSNSETNDDETNDSDSSLASNDSFDIESELFGKKKTKKVTEYYSDNESDDSLDFITKEQRKQKYVDDVIGDGDRNNDLLYDIQKQNDKARKSALIIDINLLRKGLSEDKDVDLSSYKKPTESMPVAYLEAVKRELVSLSQKSSSSQLVEEVIVLALKGAGKLLNGEREFLGIRPNLSNYHTQAQLKLRRMKYQTSQMFGKVFGNGEMNPFIQVGTNLGVGMLLYSGFNTGKKEKNDDEKYTDEKFNQDIEAINNL